MVTAQDAENQPPDFPAPCWIQGMTSEQLRQEQLKDPDVGEILRRKDAGEEKPTWPEISVHSQFVKALWALWDQLCAQDGIMYLARESAVLAFIVPRALRDKIFRLGHDGPTGGHFGIGKTLGRIRQKFYWVNLHQDVQSWCQRCLSCAKRKPPGKKTRARLQQLSGCPMERIAIDFTGPLAETTSYNRYIMIVSD